MVKMLVGALAFLMIVCPLPASAQQYSTKVITMIVPFAAGGPTDTVGRLLAQAMGTALKQQVIVENVGGAGGTIGAARVGRAPADGHTIFLHHIGHATARALRTLPYDAIRCVDVINGVLEGEAGEAGRGGRLRPWGAGAGPAPRRSSRRTARPWSNMKELIAHAKRRPGEITVGATLGSTSHLFPAKIEQLGVPS